VSSGRLGGRLAARGTDELAELGRSLDDLVVRHEGEREYQGSQAEFVDAMQVTATEDEAHDLIRRHLERSIARSKVVVLNRNNSDDRLESRTAVEPGSPLAEGLDGATPRSCLAVRFGRRHEDGRDRDALLSCEVCGKTPELATCNPLLVGGEVLAAVAEAMRASVRASDFVGRYGGEEFLLLFPDTDLEGAAIAAETIRAAVAKVTLPTVDREITASIGLASMPDDGLDGETLVRAADRCLYVTKSNGRNRVETPQGKPDAAVA